MKVIPSLAFLLLGTMLAAPAHAELIATEYFNGYGSSEIKSDGTNLSGGTGWTSAWSNADENYLPGSSLSYNATGYDNSANLGGAGDGAMSYAGNLPSVSITVRDLTTSSTTVWFSALISIDETWDRAILWIDSSTAESWGNDFVGVLDGSIHMRYNNDNVTTAGAPTAGVHLLLAKAEIDVDGDNDRLTFWFDPDLSAGEAGLGTATYSDDTADTFGTSIDGVGVMLINRDEDGSGGYVTDTDTEVEGGELMDAIRVGTTFADVVATPEAPLAEVIATEYFNGYGTTEIVSDGSNLNGGTGWTSAWLNADESYLPGSSLSYMATGYDNSANLGGSGDGAMTYAGNLPNPSVSTTTRAFTTSANTVWFSALISIDEIWDRAILWIDSVGGAAGNDFVGVLDGNIHMRVDGFNMSDAGPPTVGTHLLLAKAEIDVSGSNDRLTFWFDPDLSGGEAGLGTPTYTDDLTDTFGTAIDGIGVLLANRDPDGSGGYITDEDTEVEGGELIDAIRVGTTLAAVIAPPAAMPEVTSITKTGDTVTIEFTGAEGTSYGLNKSDNLDFTTPNIVDTTDVSGGTGTLEDTSATEGASFYRVEFQ